MERKTCFVCNRSSVVHIYNLSNMPVKLICTPEPTGELNTLHFIQCQTCMTIQLGKLIPPEVLYSDSHNTISVGNVWKKYFECFRYILEPIVYQKTVLEIGDPSAKLATIVPSYTNWTIIEPNKNPNIILPPNVYFIQSFFDTTIEHTLVDVIVHSHVFEHIYDCESFLKTCYRLLKPNGKMVFGIPNMEYIAEKELAPCLGIFFEHTVFLSRASVTYLLETSGFRIDEIHLYDDHSFIFETTKTQPQFYPIPVFPDMYTQFLSSIQTYSQYIAECNIYIQSHPNKTYYIFGVSYNTQYLLTIQGGIQHIIGILDNSTDKQWKNMYGTKYIVFPPERIANETEPVVFLKNGFYTYEILCQLKHLNANCIVMY